MKLLSIIELYRLSRAELFALHHEQVAALAHFPEGSPEAETLRVNLRLIRQALARRAPTPS